MMTEALTTCPKCGYDKGLTHWSSDDIVNWIACPKCKTFFEHGKETPQPQDNDMEIFWKQVGKDTGYDEEKKYEQISNEYIDKKVDEERSSKATITLHLDGGNCRIGREEIKIIVDKCLQIAEEMHIKLIDFEFDR